MGLIRIHSPILAIWGSQSVFRKRNTKSAQKRPREFTLSHQDLSSALRNARLATIDELLDLEQ